MDISVDRLARLLVQLGPLADAGPIEMSPALLCSWHREIFGALFPEHAGPLRSFREGRWEHVYFGVHNRGYRGTTPRELHRRLEKICTEFNTTAASIRESTPIDTYDAVHAATRLYAKVLRAHPWVDGKRVPLTYEVARRIAQQTHLLALGDPKRAAEMVAEAERAERERITA